MKKITLIAMLLTIGANAHEMNRKTPTKCIPYYVEFDKASKKKGKKEGKRALRYYSKYIECMNEKK